jgi:hypothetical protein
MRNLKITILLAAAAVCLTLASGCYVSVGPTIGYKTGSGYTLGMEGDFASYAVVHGTGGLFVSQKSIESGKRDGVIYGGLGPGIYTLAKEERYGWLAAAEVGVASDISREKGLSIMGHLGGGPSTFIGDLKNAPLVFNCLIGINYWGDGAWFYISPQIGAALGMWPRAGTKLD